jgi:hypothetical protein
VEPNTSAAPFKITGINEINTFPFAAATEVGNGKLRGFGIS